MEENKMGTVPVSRLVISMGLPLMLSLLISSLYNFVDSVFVARVSEDALTAISLAAPMQLIVSSLGLGNAVGLNAVISRALGEKNPKKVKDAASAAIFIACCSWILNCILCLAFARIYFESQSGGNEAIASYGIQYLSICMMASFGQMGQWVFDRFVMASGKSHLFIFTLSAALLGALSGNKGTKFFCFLLQAFQRIHLTSIRPRRKHRTRQHRFSLQKNRTQPAVRRLTAALHTVASLASHKIDQEHVCINFRFRLLSI